MPLLLQYCVVGQSVALVQGLAQPVLAQAKAPQSWFVPGVHVPVPLQVPAGMNMCPSAEQVGCPQGRFAGTLPH